MAYIALEIDRRFWCDKTRRGGGYGNGIQLHDLNNPDYFNYKLIEGVSYDGNILKVKDMETNDIIDIIQEPNLDLYKNTIHREWKNWDLKYGYKDEDRCDYQPWALVSKDALASNLGLTTNTSEKNMYWFQKDDSKIEVVNNINGGNSGKNSLSSMLQK
tara:strand:- start:127 stop:603 length:477 start_codon:yes stop_codon:yes gene_type:complete